MEWAGVAAGAAGARRLVAHDPLCQREIFDKIAPMAPARPRLRKLLHDLLRSDSDLEAFCGDYFPSKRARFTLGMDRTQKLTLLLDHVDADAIADALRQAYPEAGPKIDEALAAELSAVESQERSEEDGESPARLAAGYRQGLLIAAPILVALVLGGAFWKLAPRARQPPKVEVVGDPPVALHPVAVPALSGSGGVPLALPEAGASEADCTGEALTESRCSYRGSLRNQDGSPISGAHVELVGTPCVRKTDATGGFDFAGCDRIALARLTNPRVFVRFRGGTACYGTKLLKPPLMTEIQIFGNHACPATGSSLKPGDPLVAPVSGVAIE